MTDMSQNSASHRISDPSAPVLAVADVSHWYGNVVAVNDISFELAPGITGLLGPNGSGKTTLLHMLAGFLQPSAGSVLFHGRPYGHDVDLYRHTGIVQEREAVYGFLSGYDFVLLNAKLQGLRDPHTATRKAIHRVEMEVAMDRPTRDYSKGMKQRIKIAAAIVHEPNILLLDEPFNGTDPRQRIQLMDLLQKMAKEGRAILFSSHILEEIERIADTVLVIIAGRLAAAGDFRAIRRLMTDRPHVLAVHSSDDRRLASALISEICVHRVEVSEAELTVATTDLGEFAHVVPRVAKNLDISVTELVPLDESLERVFEYLVSR